MNDKMGSKGGSNGGGGQMAAGGSKMAGGGGKNGHSGGKSSKMGGKSGKMSGKKGNMGGKSGQKGGGGGKKGGGGGKKGGSKGKSGELTKAKEFRDIEESIRYQQKLITHQVNKTTNLNNALDEKIMQNFRDADQKFREIGQMLGKNTEGEGSGKGGGGKGPNADDEMQAGMRSHIR
jgi:hypothetical protein